MNPDAHTVFAPPHVPLMKIKINQVRNRGPAGCWSDYILLIVIIIIDIYPTKMMASQSQHQQHQQQLQRQFDQLEFQEVVLNLLQSFSLVSATPVEQLYEEILRKKGKVTGNDILELVTMAREEHQANQRIQQEVRMFHTRINELTRKGITCLSKLEFDSLFGQQGIIVTHITPHLKNLDYISVTKLTRVLDSIEQISQNAGRLSKDLNISRLDKSNIFSESDFISDIKTDAILDYIQTNILDAGVKINLTGMVNTLHRKIQDLTQDQLVLNEVESSLRANQEQIQNQLFKADKIISALQSQNELLKAKAKEYEEQVEKTTKKYLNDIGVLEAENQKLRADYYSLLVKSEQIETRLNWFKDNYEGINKQYSKFLEEKRQEESKNSKQREERMFIQRTVKEQLEDAQGKISRLRAENGQLRTKNTDNVMSYENKISALQDRIKQLEERLVPGKIDVLLHEGSKIRNSYLDYRSRISAVSRKPRPDPSDGQQEMCRSSVEVFSSIINENKSINPFKKKQQISIRAASIMMDSDDEEGSGQEEEEREQREKSESILQSMKIQVQKVSKNKSFQVVQQKNSQANEIGKKGRKRSDNSIQVDTTDKRVLTTHGFFMNAEGNRYPSYLILTQDRISFLDTKMRPNYSIKFQQLRKIIFCYHNTTWLVLKLKAHQRNEKNQLLIDIVFNTQNRHEILQFLHKKCTRSLHQHQIKISFQKEDSIWISSTESETLLANYKNYYNINRISTNNTLNIFRGNAKQNSIFNLSGDEVILIVTDIGILVFEDDGEFMLERYQKLLYLLPIVEFMDIQLTGSNKLLLRYQVDKKQEYKLKLKTASEARRLKKVVEDYRQSGINRRMREIEKYSVLTSVLDKSTS